MNPKILYRLALAAVISATFAASAPVLASESDDQIESSFEESYVYTTYLKDASINTEVKDGAVTLTGSVAEESHKTLAQDTVASLPGVISVDNQLETAEEIQAANADAWIGRKVKMTLFFHRNVNASATTVEVKDGVVILTGDASSIAQKELTSEYAQDIEGVTSVRNEMNVVAAPETAERTEDEKMDDASITAQVKSALSTHRSTSSISAKATTRDGEVTLTGIANNDAEKALVSKLVTDIQGVTSVKNEMTVQSAKTM